MTRAQYWHGQAAVARERDRSLLACTALAGEGATGECRFSLSYIQKCACGQPSCQPYAGTAALIVIMLCTSGAVQEGMPSARLTSD